jgi:acyl-homoserine-lactone acylase
MHLNTPNNNVYGATLVGLPGITIGFNENLGWSHTNNTIDNADTYELELTNDGYLLDGKKNEFSVSTKILKVKTKNGVLVDSTINILHAAQGPVLKKGKTKAIAIRMPGYDRPDGLLQWWQMSNAKNFNEFETALKKLQLPFFNIMYADKNGNIFHLFNGLIPVRKSGGWEYWCKTLKGSKSEDIWISVHSYSDLPKVKNPPTGWLQNANDPPWIDTYPPVLEPDSFPAYFSPHTFAFRPQRSAKMLLDDSSITYDELIEYKLSTRMEMADRILDDLFSAIDIYGNDIAREAKVVLEKWDRKADNNSVGTVIFTKWALQMQPWEQDMFKIKWDEKSPMETPDGLSDPKTAVEILEKVATEIKENYGSLSVPWGDLYRIKYNNIDLPGNGANGVFGCFRTTWSKTDTNNIDYIYGGDSWVGIIEFGDKIKANVLLSYGNSTQEGSPNNGDQLQLFSEKKLRIASFYKQDALDNAKVIQVLENGVFITK